MIIRNGFVGNSSTSVSVIKLQRKTVPQLKEIIKKLIDKYWNEEPAKIKNEVVRGLKDYYKIIAHNIIINEDDMFVYELKLSNDAIDIFYDLQSTFLDQVSKEVASDEIPGESGSVIINVSAVK